MSEIALFLANVVPWPSAATHGYVSIHWPYKPANAAKPLMPGRSFTNHGTAVAFTSGMSHRPIDLYVCMSLQSTAKPPKTNSRGKLKIDAVRAAENAVLLQGIWLDVDLTDPNDKAKLIYRDFDHAFAEFVKWYRKVGLPKPSLIVWTGSGGFHVHWTLDEPITAQRWEPLSYALYEATRAEGFVVDFKVNEASRLLRIPGTFNQKHSPAVQARIIHPQDGVVVKYPYDLLDGILSKYRVAYAPRVTNAPRLNLGRPSPVFAGVALPGRLDEGISTYVPTIDGVADECPFIDATLQTGGAGYSEPLWFESLKVAYYVQDGAQVAHRLSSGWSSATTNDTYDPKTVDDKFAEIERSHANGKIGWPQCRAIHDAGAVECAQCEHLQKGKSPLNFVLPKAVVAAAAAVATAVTPVAHSAVVIPPVQTTFQVPPDYVMGKDGRFYKVEAEDKRPMVMPYRILNMWVQRPGEDAGGEWALNMEIETTKTNKPVVETQFAYEELHDLRLLGRSFGKQGVVLHRNYLKHTADFMVSFVEQLNTSAANNRVEESVATGWQVNSGKRCAFVFGGKYYANGSTRNVVPRDRTLHELYSPHGSLDAWKAACKLATDQKRPAMNAVISTMFAAPLVGPAGFTGCVLAVKGESGIGKSHSLRVSLAGWAHPTLAMGRWDDTANNVDTRLGENPHVPHLFDEIKDDVKARKLVDQIMMLGQGKSKGRNNRASRAMPVMSWATMMGLGANTDIADLMDEHVNMTVAGINRVFQIYMEPPKGLGMISRTDAEIIIRELDTNYGHAGALYAEFLGKDPAMVEDAVKRTMAAVDTAVQGGKDDRFHVATISTLLVGAKFANAIGLVDIDLDRMGGYLIEQLQEQRNRRSTSRADLTKETNILRYIEEYLGARRDFTLVSQRMWRGMGPPRNFDAGALNRSDLPNLFVHASREDKVVQISLSDFRAFLKKQDLNSTHIVRHLLEIPAASKTKAYLGLGTMYRDPNRLDVIELDLTKLPGVFQF